MIHINKDLINETIKSEYLKYYLTILDTINETYRYAYYIKGMEDFFGQKKLVGARYEYFIKDTLQILKEKICLNFWKLYLDEGTDALTLKRMKGHIFRSFNLIVEVKDIAISKQMKDNIAGLRTNSISHNLDNEKESIVFINELMNLMGEITSYFQELWVEELIDKNYKISNTYFTDFEELYRNSVKDVLNGING